MLPRSNSRHHKIFFWLSRELRLFTGWFLCCHILRYFSSSLMQSLLSMLSWYSCHQIALARGISDYLDGCCGCQVNLKFKVIFYLTQNSVEHCCHCKIKLAENQLVRGRWVKGNSTPVDPSVYLLCVVPVQHVVPEVRWRRPTSTMYISRTIKY